jgi:YidC/Oxa1 family membrane protein insertase
MFDTLIINPILNALFAIYKGLELLHIPYSFGFAIITLTVAIRFALNPFFKKQIESQTKMSSLKPQMTELEQKFKDDKSRLQQAQMNLYKENGINPLSGCLFAIVQIPVFIGLYQVLNKFVTAGADSKLVAEINKIAYIPELAITKIDPRFFILNLATAPSHFKFVEFTSSSGIVLNTANFGSAYYLLVPLITAVLQYFQAKTSMFSNPPKTEVTKSDDDTSEKGKSESVTEDFQKAMNTQMKYFFPIMIGFFSYTLPVGLSLYWNIFSIFSIIQSAGTKKGSVKPVVAELTK